MFNRSKSRDSITKLFFSSLFISKSRLELSGLIITLFLSRFIKSYSEPFLITIDESNWSLVKYLLLRAELLILKF